MVYELEKLVGKKIKLRDVLILVFVEDGLWGMNFIGWESFVLVLILVFVEDGLWAKEVICKITSPVVLILVFVEDGLWVEAGHAVRLMAVLS